MEVKLFRSELRLRNTFRIAHGASTTRESLFLWIRSGDRVGMGEAPIVPYYGVSADEMESDMRAHLSLELLHRALEGKPVPPACFAHPASRCAVASAALSFGARIKGDAPGVGPGVERGAAAPPTSFTIAFDDDASAMVDAAVSCGFHRLKLKAGIPGDIERIRLIRERLPDAVLRVDANQGWSPGEAAAKIEELERLDIELVEEPIGGSPAELERIAAATTVPILLDESVRSLAQLRLYAKEAPSVAGIVVKIAKNGGPDQSMRLVHEAREIGWEVMVSSMIETSLGVSFATGMASLCRWCDLDAPLLLDADPFVGLSYVGERPTLAAPCGVQPSEGLRSFIDSLDPILEEG